MKYRIRFNRSAGQPGRGTVDHKWRVFDETGKEWLCKRVYLMVTSVTEKDPNSNDWNIVAHGDMEIYKSESMIVIL